MHQPHATQLQKAPIALLLLLQSLIQCLLLHCISTGNCLVIINVDKLTADFSVYEALSCVVYNVCFQNIFKLFSILDNNTLLNYKNDISTEQCAYRYAADRFCCALLHIIIPHIYHNTLIVHLV